MFSRHNKRRKDKINCSMVCLCLSVYQTDIAQTKKNWVMGGFASFKTRSCRRSRPQGQSADYDDFGFNTNQGKNSSTICIQNSKIFIHKVTIKRRERLPEIPLWYLSHRRASCAIEFLFALFEVESLVLALCLPQPELLLEPLVRSHALSRPPSNAGPPIA